MTNGFDSSSFLASDVSFLSGGLDCLLFGIGVWLESGLKTSALFLSASGDC